MAVADGPGPPWDGARDAAPARSVVVEPGLGARGGCTCQDCAHRLVLVSFFSKWRMAPVREGREAPGGPGMGGRGGFRGRLRLVASGDGVAAGVAGRGRGRGLTRRAKAEDKEVGLSCAREAEPLRQHRGGGPGHLHAFLS